MLAQEAFDFTPAELVRIIDHGFRSSFLPLYQKSRLRAEALASCVEILLEVELPFGSFLKNLGRL